MKCTICRNGETVAGTTTVTMERGKTIVVVRGVPAAICQTCGEYYLDEEVAQRVYRQAEDAVKRNAEVEILRYAA